MTLDGSLPPLGFRQYQTIDLSGWNGRARSRTLDPLKAAHGRGASRAFANRPRARPGASSAPATCNWRLTAAVATALLLAGAAFLYPRVCQWAAAEAGRWRSGISPKPRPTCRGAFRHAQAGDRCRVRSRECCDGRCSRATGGGLGAVRHERQHQPARRDRAVHGQPAQPRFGVVLWSGSFRAGGCRRGGGAPGSGRRQPGYPLWPVGRINLQAADVGPGRSPSISNGATSIGADPRLDRPSSMPRGGSP